IRHYFSRLSRVISLTASTKLAICHLGNDECFACATVRSRSDTSSEVSDTAVALLKLLNVHSPISILGGLFSRTAFVTIAALSNTVDLCLSVTFAQNALMSVVFSSSSSVIFQPCLASLTYRIM